tara:strand:+ start:539 stop:1243 length:705 start_codon:yes stop_codon:yes gene_type:complete
MNKRFCVFFLLIPFVFYSQKAKDDNLPPQCDISISKNYIVKTTVTKEEMLDDPKFINQLKERLIAQISSVVTSELTISSSKRLNKKSKLKTDNNIDIVARGILNDPNIDYCDGIVIISINKKEYKAKQYDFFKAKLRLANSSLEHLLQMGFIEDKKFLKEKIEYYKLELNQLTTMLPLVQIQSIEEKIFNSLTNNVVLLENKKFEIKLMRKKKRNEFFENIKNGINNLTDKLNI